MHDMQSVCQHFGFVHAVHLTGTWQGNAWLQAAVVQRARTN